MKVDSGGALKRSIRCVYFNCLSLLSLHRSVHVRHSCLGVTRVSGKMFIMKIRCLNKEKKIKDIMNCGVKRYTQGVLSGL